MNVTILDLFVAVFIALAVHEAGHAVAALRLGIPVRAVRVGWPCVLRRRWLEIGLLPMVGWVRADVDGTTPQARITMALAGPASNLLLVPLIFLPGWWGLAGLVSLIIGLANLLPVPPLDGGQVVLEALDLAGVRINRPAVTRCGLLMLLVLHVPLLLPPALWLAGVGAVGLGSAVGLALRGLHGQASKNVIHEKV